MNMGKWNVAETYRFVTDELMNKHVPERPVFVYFEREKAIKRRPLSALSNEEILRGLDCFDKEIITRVAASKYLTSLQVSEFMGMSGVSRNRECVKRHLQKLVNQRVLIEQELVRDGASRGLKVYSLDFLGNQVAYMEGVALHKGIKYVSEKKRIEQGIKLDSPEDLKRVLVGNQILLGMLKNKVHLQRFGIMETVRIESELSSETGAIIRTALTARVDSENILMFEVVRNNPTAIDNLIEKAFRYLKIVSTSQYIASNSNGDSALPQLVICGEDTNHNQKIFKALEESGFPVWDHEILFTVDLLWLQETRKTLYIFNKKYEREWYQLPDRFEYLNASA